MLTDVSYPDYTGWLNHDLVEASTKTYTGESGAARKNLSRLYFKVLLHTPGARA